MQFSDEARHLFLEGVAVVFDFLGPDVAAGREDVSVPGDFGVRGGFAEASHVRIRSRGVFSFQFSVISRNPGTPCVIRGGDSLKINVRQFAMDTVDEGAEFARVDEEGLFASVSVSAFGVGFFAFR